MDTKSSNRIKSISNEPMATKRNEHREFMVGVLVGHLMVWLLVAGAVLGVVSHLTP